MPFTGFDTTWSVKPAASAPYLPDYDPDSASTGTMWATGEKTIDERISQGPSSADRRPRRNLKTVLELAQKRGMKVGDVSTAEITDATRRSSPRTSRCAAARARPTWPPARPRPRRPAASARSPSRRSTTRSTCCWAAAAAASPRRSPAVPTAARRWSESAQAKGYRYVTDADGLSTVAQRQQAAARPLHQQQHVAGVDRPGGLARQGQRAGACTEGVRPGERAEPGGDVAAGDRPARRQQPQRVLPAGRGCLDRQAGPRHQRLRSARRDGRLRPRDRRRARLPGAPPRHAGRGHRRSLPHQPDRGRGQRRGRDPDRVLDQPAEQGRADAQPHLRNRGLRRQRAAPAAPNTVSQQHTGAVVPVWASGPGCLACSGRTTTRTCSTSSAAEPAGRMAIMARG